MTTQQTFVREGTEHIIVQPDGTRRHVSKTEWDREQNAVSSADRTFKRSDLQKLTPAELNALYETGGLRQALAEGRVTND